MQEKNSEDKKNIGSNVVKQALKKRETTTRKDIKFYSTGITLLDLCLGGGIGKGYVSNFQGHESSGKTLLICEILGFNHNTNKDFKHKFENAEAGFTINTKKLYNYSMNFITPQSETVEQFMYNFEKEFKKVDSSDILRNNFIYVLDSLDGISDDREAAKHKKDMQKIKKSIEEEKDSDVKGDYSGKAKLMSQFFRQNNSLINRTGGHLLITSQLRDKPGVIYGEKECRSGGKALNYYAAQIIKLKIKEKLVKKVKIDDRVFEKETGTLVKVFISKNKLGKPFSSCYLFIDFNFGVDNIKSNIYYLYDLFTPKGEMRSKDKLVWDKEEFTINGLIRHIEKNNLEKELEKRVINLWEKVDIAFDDNRKKKY